MNWLKSTRIFRARKVWRIVQIPKPQKELRTYPSRAHSKEDQNSRVLRIICFVLFSLEILKKVTLNAVDVDEQKKLGTVLHKSTKTQTNGTTEDNLSKQMESCQISEEKKPFIMTKTETNFKFDFPAATWNILFTIKPFIIEAFIIKAFLIACVIYYHTIYLLIYLK